MSKNVSSTMNRCLRNTYTHLLIKHKQRLTVNLCELTDDRADNFPTF